MGSMPATAGGDPVGRTAVHFLDGDGAAVPASGTTPLPTSSSAATPIVVLTRASAPSAAGNTGALDTSAVAQLAVDIAIASFTGGTAPSVTFLLERQGTDGAWYQVWSSGSRNTAGAASTSVGPGCTTPEVLTDAVRLRWTLGGTVAPTAVTFSASLVGR